MKKYTMDQIEKLCESQVFFLRYDKEEDVYVNKWSIHSAKTWGFRMRPEVDTKEEAQSILKNMLVTNFLYTNTTYINPFYNKNYQDSKPEITTSVYPENYKGHQLFELRKDLVHIVKSGVCVGMYAGINGAKKRVDEITNFI